MKKTSIKLLIFCFLFFSPFLYSQIKLPPISNFTSIDYEGGNQNWNIESANGHIYIGNNEGLLEFDGINWYLYTLPNKTIVRSVKVVGDRIYTGSYEEFGYWTRLKTGKLHYTSLRNKITEDQIVSQSIWGIYKTDTKIIFKSFGSIYIYENDTVKVLNPDFILMAGFVLNNRFIVQGVNKGLVELIDNKFVLLENTQPLKATSVQAITSLKNNELLIGTLQNGLYTYSNNNLKTWNNSFNNLLKEHQLNALKYLDGKVYAGTIKKGIYQYDLNNEKFRNLNIKNGLQNNTVLALTIDDSNILWAALDNGISAIPINYYLHYLNPYKEEIGAVYDMVKHGNEVYLATNTGIYKTQENGIHFIKGSQGHTWSLNLIDNQIICGHNSGTFKIEDNQFLPISHKNGGYVFKLIPKQSNKFIQGNYTGLTVYTKNKSNWEFKDVLNLNIPVKNIVFEKPHVAWVLHAYKGVFRIHFSENYEQVIKIEKQYNNEFSNIYDIKLFKIENDIAFYNNAKWYVFNPLENNIDDYKSLNKILGKDKNSIILNKEIENPIVFKTKKNTLFIRKNLQDSLSQIYIPKKYYNNKLVRGEGEQRAIIVNDSLIYLSLYDDVLVVNPEVQPNTPIKAPTFSRIFKKGIPQELNSEIHLQKNDTLKIEISSQYLTNNTLEYSLENGYWNTTDGTIILSGLPYGSVNLTIRSLLNFKEYSQENKVELYVDSPWYFGIWGGILLLVLLILIIFIITVINKYVLIKHKKYLDEQFKHKQEIHRKEEALKNEIKLNELQKRQHEIALNSKTKELANTAMEMSKKDELLENIKSELNFFQKEIISKAKYEKLIKTINKNINTSKDWELFETNFNKIHDSFFKNLLNNHETLTPKDLKLCAYLKMNLTTKEIAPLMSISPRGVEIHRYRLRKKLNIENNQNLNEFFMKI